MFFILYKIMPTIITLMLIVTTMAYFNNKTAFMSACNKGNVQCYNYTKTYFMNNLYNKVDFNFN